MKTVCLASQPIMMMMLLMTRCTRGAITTSKAITIDNACEKDCEEEKEEKTQHSKI